MKHKHYDLIVQWAKGAEIEQRNTNPLKPELGDWHPFDGHWGDSTWIEWEYRVKPAPKKEFVLHCYVDAMGCEFTITKANLKLTYDGYTKKLTKAEVL